MEVLPPLADFPDSIFVEDPAFVLPEGAILLRPGAPSRARRGRRRSRRRSRRISARSRGSTRPCRRRRRADPAGRDPDRPVGAHRPRRAREALARWLESLGRAPRIVATPPGVLHFKTACALLDEETVIADARPRRGGAVRRAGDRSDQRGRGGGRQSAAGERSGAGRREFPAHDRADRQSRPRGAAARRRADRPDRRRPLLHVVALVTPQRIGQLGSSRKSR